jgi:hypothetical protein
MTLTVPAYLVESGVQTQAARFKWDEWKLKDIEEPYDEVLIERLATCFSQRAILAVGLGSAEWLVYRFMALNNDPAPWDYLEAAWAMMVHYRYSNYGNGTGWIEHAEGSADPWEGAVRGPVTRALTIVQSTIQELAWHGPQNPAEYSRYAARSMATVHRLALHVMEHPAPYSHWMSAALDRLQKTCPLVPGDEVGDVVPRSALNPSEPFEARRIQELVDGFLRHLDPNANPFLSDVEGMMQHIEDDEEPDFPGTPYRFSLALDREVRKAAAAGSGQPP